MPKRKPIVINIYETGRYFLIELANADNLRLPLRAYVAARRPDVERFTDELADVIYAPVHFHQSSAALDAIAEQVLFTR